MPPDGLSADRHSVSAGGLETVRVPLSAVNPRKQGREKKEHRCRIAAHPHSRHSQAARRRCSHAIKNDEVARCICFIEMFLFVTVLFLQLLSGFALNPPATRTSPPSGSLIVRSGTTTSGEYKTLASAVAALPADTSSQTIFIYPGTYTGQVLVQRSGPVTVFAIFLNTSTFSLTVIYCIDHRIYNQLRLSGSEPGHTHRRR
jgi:hypothetical protein